ncbi:MAG: replication initiator protein A [Acutalibacteraceae bacterium]
MKENYIYYQMPKFLFSEEYSLSASAKILYTLMLDRKRISEMNSEKFTDEEGNTFILFSRETAAKMLLCHKNTVTTYIGELKKAGLISVKKHNFTEYRIYIHEIKLSTPQNDTLGINNMRFIADAKSVSNNNKDNNNKFNKKYQRREKEKEERPKPSYDIDAFTKKAFSNPMLLLEKKKKAQEKNAM